MKPARATLLLLLAGLVVVFGLASLALWSKPRRGLDFDPRELAARETRMWRAYYDERNEQVAVVLVAVLREQFGLSYAVSVLTARDFAAAAAWFRKRQNDDATGALPALERGYDRIRRATRAEWDARAVAEAELAWWVARRTPGQWNNESVGGAIGRLYELLYGIDPAAAVTAGQLRARAAEIRFVGAHTEGVDWNRVEDLLAESYGELRRAIARR